MDNVRKKFEIKPNLPMGREQELRVATSKFSVTTFEINDADILELAQVCAEYIRQHNLNES